MAIRRALDRLERTVDAHPAAGMEFPRSALGTSVWGRARVRGGSRCGVASFRLAAVAVEGTVARRKSSDVGWGFRDAKGGLTGAEASRHCWCSTLAWWTGVTCPRRESSGFALIGCELASAFRVVVVARNGSEATRNVGAQRAGMRMRGRRTRPAQSPVVLRCDGPWTLQRIGSVSLSLGHRSRKIGPNSGIQTKPTVGDICQYAVGRGSTSQLAVARNRLQRSRKAVTRAGSLAK